MTAARPALSDAQRLAWLRLIRSENVGPVTFRELMSAFGDAAEALEALPELSRRGGRKRALRICPEDEAARELNHARTSGAELRALGEAGYPTQLATLEAPPPLLYTRGRPEIADKPAFAMVGARDASAAGRKVAASIARDLGRRGLVIASGLARGIDTAAHEAALPTGTIAVMAGGIDVIYPPENEKLAAAIAECGLLVTEFAPGLSPRGRDFPRRNRIISGISLGVLVVEAALRSGSRITADFAREQGRKLFAVPGHPLDPRAGGTNQLLKEGARLVTEAGDVVAGLGPLPAVNGPPPASFREPTRPMADATNTERSRIIEALGPAPVGIDDLARLTGAGIREVRVVLMELELAGRLERMGGQRVALRV